MSVVTLQEAKEHLQVDADYTLTDELIQGFLDTAQAWCEQYTGISFSVQEFVKVAAGRRTELMSPVVSIQSVKGMDDDVTVAYAQVNNIIHTSCYNLYNPAVIKYTAGYEPEKLPAPIKTAIKMMVADLYQNRQSYGVVDKGSVIQLPVGVKDLLQPYSRVGGLFL